MLTIRLLAVRPHAHVLTVGQTPTNPHSEGRDLSRQEHGGPFTSDAHLQSTRLMAWKTFRGNGHLTSVTKAVNRAGMRGTPTAYGTQAAGKISHAVTEMPSLLNAAGDVLQRHMWPHVPPTSTLIVRPRYRQTAIAAFSLATAHGLTLSFCKAAGRCSPGDVFTDPGAQLDPELEFPPVWQLVVRLRRGHAPLKSLPRSQRSNLRLPSP